MAQAVVDQESLRTIVEMSGDGLVVVDEHRLVRFMNRTSAGFLSADPGAMIGRPFNQAIQTGQLGQIDIALPGGKKGIGELRATDIQWGGKQAMLVSIRDVTERILFDRLKDDFVSNVSHELRTPLTAIREAVSLMRDGILGAVTEKQIQFLSMCLRNADHLRRIVDTLLDLSKIEAGRIRLAKRRADLCEIAQAVAEAFVPVAAKKGLVLELECKDGPFEVFADRDRIVQVLNNLIGNAVKFTPKGRIGVSLHDGGEDVRCVVRDTGRGIAESDLPQVFSKFQQFGEASGPENKGTGLGLAISKEIVRLHQGQITVTSVLEQGSTFAFTMPKYRPDFELLEPVRNRMADSPEPFLLFGLRLGQSEEIASLLGSHSLQKMTMQMMNAFKNVAKPIGSVTLDPDQAVFLIENPQGPASRTNRRILRAVKEAFFGLGIDSEPAFRFGASTYPEDGDTPEALLDACRGRFRDEAQQRLSKRILIVDDERALVDATVTLLNLLGYENIDTAENGMVAFEKLAKSVPDLLILDMKMPGMSGYEVIGRLKENHDTKELPILIMSGYEVETGRFVEYINKKAILTLNKPADPEILRKTIYYLL
jgi:signal transduction histidine kinase/CheY-like chemotaxis protein